MEFEIYFGISILLHLGKKYSFRYLLLFSETNHHAKFLKNMFYSIIQNRLQSTVTKCFLQFAVTFQISVFLLRKKNYSFHFMTTTPHTEQQWCSILEKNIMIYKMKKMSKFYVENASFSVTDLRPNMTFF